MRKKGEVKERKRGEEQVKRVRRMTQGEGSEEQTTGGMALLKSPRLAASL